MDKKDHPIAELSTEEREKVWDETYAKEEGVILEFHSGNNTGRLRSLSDGSLYAIDGRELIMTKIELRQGDKVLFAPIEDPDGDDYARIIRII